MPKELLNQWSQMSRTALEVYCGRAETKLEAANRLFQQHLELVGIAVEGGLRQANLLFAPHHYRHVAEQQAQLAGAVAEQLATVARRTNDVLVEANNKFSAWADKSVRAATDQVQRTQQAASTSAKKAAA